MRPQAWVIVERKSASDDQDDTFDVMHGRTSSAIGLRSMGSARSIVTAHRREGERVWHEDAEDGYRSELTSSYPAPSPPVRPSGGAAVPIDPERPARTRYLANYGRSKHPGKWF